MGLFDHLSRVVRSHLNELVSNTQEPESVMEQFLSDMQEDLLQLRATVAKVLASQKKPQITPHKQQPKASKWQKSIDVILSKHHENLERQTFYRQRPASARERTSNLPQLELQPLSPEVVKYHLTALESKILRGKTRINLFSSLIQSKQTSTVKLEQEAEESSSVSGMLSSPSPEMVVDPEIAKLLSELDKI
jgi:phage shock protein A